MLKIAKLNTREFVLGRLSNNVLINVMLINFDRDSLSGNLGYHLVPYMSPLDLGIGTAIGMDKVVCCIDPSQAMVKKYISVMTEYLKQAEAEYQTEQENQIKKENENGDNNREISE